MRSFVSSPAVVWSAAVVGTVALALATASPSAAACRRGQHLTNGHCCPAGTSWFPTAGCKRFTMGPINCFKRPVKYKGIQLKFPSFVMSPNDLCINGHILGAKCFQCYPGTLYVGYSRQPYFPYDGGRLKCLVSCGAGYFAAGPKQDVCCKGTAPPLPTPK